MNNEARTALTRARAVLILDQPFFGTLALRLEPVEDYAIPTAAVDGRHLFYNPDYLLAQTDRVRLSVVAHEVIHCVADHMGREGNREHGKWGRAADYADNLILFDAGFDIPATWLLDHQYAAMSAEHIYTLLPDQEGGGPGPGEPGGPMDDIRRPPAGSTAAAQATQAELARDWVVATIQAAQAAKAAGKLPASLEQLVESISDPKIDWQTRLRRFVTERSMEDYSWARPNRRMIVHGIYLPSLYTETLGPIDIAVDASGSMWDRPTQAAMAAEIDAIIEEARPRRVRVIYCDCMVQRIQVLERGEPFTFGARGGGGTAFKPVFDWVERQSTAGEEAPAALIYLTDLIGPTAFDPPPYPVLWCTTTERTGPWGETLRIEL